MAQIQPPETFDFSTPNEWPKWRKRFERYLLVSGMKKKEEADKIDLFMYLMGDRADDIFRTFKFEKEEEATKIDSVLKAIQEDREPVDEFITSLYKLADSCEFEGLHEQLIHDRIVVGVRDKALSERMQLDSELTLEKAVKMVRQQQVDLQRPSTSQKSIRKKEKSAKTRSRCPKCGGFNHREGQACRAEGQKCNLCSKTGHFANCCPDKQAKTAKVKAFSELYEEIGFLLEVSAVEDSSNLDDDEGECRRRWTAEIQVNGKQVKFKLDSQADVTCVPLCLFKKIMGQQRLVESDINIRKLNFVAIYLGATKINPIKEFPEVFEGLGQIGNPYEIKLKPGAKPYAVHTPRWELLAADALSRQPLLTTEGGENERPTSAHINAVLSSITDKDEMLMKIFEAQQEDTTLKAVVNYLEQGWPDKKKMSQTLLSYWHVKDELGVQNGLLMRICRLVIPASMKLEILDKLHAGHFGITKTRLRARETVWWPGISEEIAETVRKCSVCIQEAVSKHEPLIPTNFPTRPWQKIGMDLFKFENKWYLVVIDYYFRFPEMIQLDRLTASVVVRSCKSIFARHGIPETVVSDNGTQFGAAREFANFARQYGFTHVTSSPRFPQSNGMAEAGVKIAKLILKKNQDPSLGLLEYRSTPLENGYSPAELLMGSKLRTTLPIAPENLNPRLVDSQTLKRKEGRRRKDMKSRYDRRCGATDMEELSEVGTLRRNRFHLRKGYTVQYPADPSTPTFSGEELVENEKTPVVDYPSNDSEDGQIRTRTCTVSTPHVYTRPCGHASRELPSFSPLASGITSRMATNLARAESPSKAEDKPVRLGSKAQPSAEITAKDVLQNKNPIVLTKNQNYVNPSAGSQDANSAAPVDLAAIPTSDAAAQVRRNWADITEEVNPGAEEGFTLVQGRKRRRGSANSPTAAAPSSNPGGSRTIRRPQPSAGSVPRAQEIRVTRAHIAEARARQASSSEEHCVYIEHSPELEPFHYLRALDRMLGGTAGVIQITKVNGHQLLGLTNRGLAERLISEGLEVEGTLLRAFPFRKRAERITVGNLPFFVADSAVITALSPYGRVTSIAPKQMKAGPYVYVDGRRDVFITLHEGITIERIPTRLDINIKGQAWPAYLSSGIRCSRCHGQGHRRAICPLLAGLANNTRTAPPTTPAGVPPPTTPAPPQRSAAQPPAPTPSNPAMEVCSAPPVARAALHSSAPRPSPPAAPAFPMEETPPAPPPVTPAPSLQTPGSRESAAPTPDVEMSIVEETFASSTSSAKNATRVDLDAFIEGLPSVSFAKTDALGLGREEVLDLLSSRTKAQRKGPLLSPPQCDALVGLIGQILDLKPGHTSNLYKVLGQVKAELRTTPAVPPTPPLPAPRPSGPTPPTSHSEELMPAVMTPPPPALEDDPDLTQWQMSLSLFQIFMKEPDLGPTSKSGIDQSELTDATLNPRDREELIEQLLPRQRNILAQILDALLERALDLDPFLRGKLSELRASLPP
ncbi:K02A2.6-like [Cordylochernes scorpioides]|uniref:RNA-directed DNA polymerase n=1 Tax=Cordylochernes scorpioides TaxID=51811 RepID=A0ABY6KK40_9ARAC|nr:K02A2.6-like [Cordylochernes scorpioides]